jgi:hypothetical protein
MEASAKTDFSETGKLLRTITITIALDKLLVR